MTKTNIPWDQILANRIVRSLVNTNITPNQVTGFSLLLATFGAGLFSIGQEVYNNLGAGLFVIARFIDHVDGELARRKNMTTKAGYYLDYFVGGASYSVLFLCLGVGFQDGHLGAWSIAIGTIGAICAIACAILNIRVDHKKEEIDISAGESVGYPSLWGVELEDGIYLIAPITWCGWLEWFFISAGFGALIYGVWTIISAMRTR